MVYNRKYIILVFLALFLLPETARDIHFIAHHFNDRREFDDFSGIVIDENKETCPFMLVKFLPRIAVELPYFLFKVYEPIVYLKFERCNPVLYNTFLLYLLRGPPR